MMTILLLTLSLTALHEDTTRLFNDGNTAFYQGQYEQAVNAYTEALNAGRIKSPVLYYNMGNTWYRLGSLGKAILYYEAALALDPDFEPARKNLGEVLRQTKRQLPSPDPHLVDTRIMARYYPLTPMQSLWAVHVTVAVSIVLLIWLHFRPGPRLRWAARLAPILALTLYALTIAANAVYHDAPRLAVTHVAEAPVFFSMNESEQPRFLLYEGDRVLIDRVEGDWMRVTAHGGERGWTLKENLGVVEYAFM